MSDQSIFLIHFFLLILSHGYSLSDFFLSFNHKFLFFAETLFVFFFCLLWFSDVSFHATHSPHSFKRLPPNGITDTALVCEVIITVYSSSLAFLSFVFFCFLSSCCFPFFALLLEVFLSVWQAKDFMFVLDQLITDSSGSFLYVISIAQK